jgi:hypothetical protein
MAAASAGCLLTGSFTPALLLRLKYMTTDKILHQQPGSAVFITQHTVLFAGSQRQCSAASHGCIAICVLPQDEHRYKTTRMRLLIGQPAPIHPADKGKSSLMRRMQNVSLLVAIHVL